MVHLSPQPMARTAALTVLSVYAFVLLLLPSRFVVGPLGAAGTPAGLLACGLLFWYLFAWMNPRSDVVWQPQPMRLAAAALAGVVLLSYAFAMARPMETIELNAADRGLIIVAGWLGIMLLTADGIDRMESLRRLQRRIVGLGTFLAVLGIVQFFFGLDLAQHISIPGLSLQGAYESLASRYNFNRVSGTALHPIEFGMVLGLTLPMAVHCARYAKPGKGVRAWLKVAVIAACMAMTVSRSAFMAAGIAALIILPTWEKRERRRAYLALLGFFVLMQGAAPGLVAVLRRLVTQIGKDSSTQYRTQDYDAALHYFGEYPVVGRGFGTFLPNLYRILDNQYLVSLIDTGLLGLAAVVGLFACGWSLARRARKASSDPETRHMAQCLAAAVAMAAFSLATYDAFAFPSATGMTFLILGSCGALWRLVTRPAPLYLETPATRPADASPFPERIHA